MSECERSRRWFGSCRFEPRYDEPMLSETERALGRDGKWVLIPGTTSVTWETPPLGERVYVHDICIRCGKVVNRTILADATPKSPKEPA